MAPELSNWGRWGPDDEQGTLNLLTPERVLSALRLVKSGKVYNLAVPLEKGGPQFPTFHKTWRVTYYRDDHGRGVADDVVMMESHSGTHLDALGHFWQDGKMWNGRSSAEVSSAGIGWAGIHRVSALVGRGVMLDMAAFKGVPHLQQGEVVTPRDMDACARAQKVRITAGDILLVHTGWSRVFQSNRALWEQGEPGPDVSCGQWLKDKDIVAIGADNPGVEAMSSIPRQGSGPTLHTVALRDLGVYLIENVHLEELARDKVYEFLFVGAPLRLTSATGAPMSPLAMV